MMFQWAHMNYSSDPSPEFIASESCSALVWLTWTNVLTWQLVLNWIDVTILNVEYMVCMLDYLVILLDGLFTYPLQVECLFLLMWSLMKISSPLLHILKVEYLAVFYISPLLILPIVQLKMSKPLKILNNMLPMTLLLAHLMFMILMTHLLMFLLLPWRFPWRNTSPIICSLQLKGGCPLLLLLPYHHLSVANFVVLNAYKLFINYIMQTTLNKTIQTHSPIYDIVYKLK